MHCEVCMTPPIPFPGQASPFLFAWPIRVETSVGSRSWEKGHTTWMSPCLTNHLTPWRLNTHIQFIISRLNHTALCIQLGLCPMTSCIKRGRFLCHLWSSGGVHHGTCVTLNRDLCRARLNHCPHWPHHCFVNLLCRGPLTCDCLTFRSANQQRS